jgi:hypothetical protein
MVLDANNRDQAADAPPSLQLPGAFSVKARRFGLAGALNATLIVAPAASLLT